MNNYSSINSGTFSNPRQCNGSTPCDCHQRSSSINSPHFFSRAANAYGHSSSIPLQGAPYSSINSRHLPPDIQITNVPPTRSQTPRPEPFYPSSASRRAADQPSANSAQNRWQQPLQESKVSQSTDAAAAAQKR